MGSYKQSCVINLAGTVETYIGTVCQIYKRFALNLYKKVSTISGLDNINTPLPYLFLVKKFVLFFVGNKNLCSLHLSIKFFAKFFNVYHAIITVEAGSPRPCVENNIGQYLARKISNRSYIIYFFRRGV